MKKVLVITYYWPPSGGAGVQRILKFVKYLPQFGITPYVVTVDPGKASYPVYDETLINDIPSEAKVFTTGTFEPYELYSKFLGKKSIPTGFSNESNPSMFQKFSRFVRGNFFIPDGRRGWIKHALRKSIELIEKENIHTVLTTSPPHSAHLVGLKLKKKFNIKWTADLRDPWTDIYYYNEFHHTAFAKKLDLKFEREVLENADHIVTVSKSLKELFVLKSDLIDPSKIIVIPNGYDEDDFKIKSKRQNEFIISYTGTMADSYNPNIFFDVLKTKVQKYPEVKFIIRFVGNPAASVIHYIENIGLKNNLDLIPTVTHEKVTEYLLESTALLLVIPDIKNDKGILTGKLFEYLAAKKSVICIGPEDGDAAQIINECEAGKTFDRNASARLEEYLDDLIKAWKKNASLDIQNEKYKKYSRRNQSKELARIISGDKIINT
ncbi:MAG: glycosyltransferase family 4 protein [bacterium]|nr:glycosyltransferase family 4 protein [bacterium]